MVGQRWIFPYCQQIENRLDNLEEKFHFDVETTIVAQGVPVTPGHDPFRQAEDLVYNGIGTQGVSVVRAKRLSTRNNKPGLMKIEVRSLDEKIRILRDKKKLANHNVYGRVFVRSSKSHAERLMEANLWLLLQQLPQGHQLRVAGSGKLVFSDPAYQPSSSSYGAFAPQQTFHPPNPSFQRGPRPQQNFPQSSPNVTVPRYPGPGFQGHWQQPRGPPPRGPAPSHINHSEASNMTAVVS
jgi:hypothetical protein